MTAPKSRKKTAVPPVEAEAARQPVEAGASAPMLEVGGKAYQLELATAGLIALERAHNMGFMKLPELFEDTRLESLRDILAAALIEHHPATNRPDGMLPLHGIAAAILGARPGPRFEWEAQQELADSIIDELGAFAVMQACGRAFYSARLLRDDDAREL